MSRGYFDVPCSIFAEGFQTLFAAFRGDGDRLIASVLIVFCKWQGLRLGRGFLLYAEMI